jgi:hypothetical protein
MVFFNAPAVTFEIGQVRLQAPHRGRFAMSDTQFSKIFAPAVGVFFLSVGLSFAETYPLGTSATKIEPALSPPDMDIQPAFGLTFTGAQYATAGVSLRNRRFGIINLSGAVKPIKKAILYWAYLISNTKPIPVLGSTQKIAGFCSYSSGSGGGVNISCNNPIVGQLIATGVDPCWGSGRMLIYGVDITTKLSGIYGSVNGSYQISLTSDQSADSSGSDPWSSSSVAFPAAEGASLVVVGTGDKTVNIYDQGISGKTFNKSKLTYNLLLGSTAAPSEARFDNIVADGQIGAGRRPYSIATGETITINGTKISGLGSTLIDSASDGTSGWPLPQLWDDTGHDITDLAAGNNKLVVEHSSGGDCLTPIANVVSFTPAAAP